MHEYRLQHTSLSENNAAQDSYVIYKLFKNTGFGARIVGPTISKNVAEENNSISTSEVASQNTKGEPHKFIMDDAMIRQNWGEILMLLDGCNDQDVPSI